MVVGFRLVSQYSGVDTSLACVQAVMSCLKTTFGSLLLLLSTLLDVHTESINERGLTCHHNRCPRSLRKISIQGNLGQ